MTREVCLFLGCWGVPIPGDPSVKRCGMRENPPTCSVDGDLTFPLKDVIDPTDYSVLEGVLSLSSNISDYEHNKTLGHVIDGLEEQGLPGSCKRGGKRYFTGTTSYEEIE